LHSGEFLDGCVIATERVEHIFALGLHGRTFPPDCTERKRDARAPPSGIDTGRRACRVSIRFGRRRNHGNPRE
jgi:hypothetical protein